MSFDGFSTAGFDFLTELGENDKAWFDANRKTYDTEVVVPAKAYVTAMGDALREQISEAIEAQPKTNGSIAPINNDLRFNPDSSPYKDHLMFRFWEGPVKKTSAMLMVRVHPRDGIGFACGMNFGDVEQWREAIADDKTGKAFARALDDLVAATGSEVVGQGLKKVPKPFPDDHPRGELLKHKGFQARWQEPVPKQAGSGELVDWCVERLAKTADLHRWFVENMT